MWSTDITYIPLAHGFAYLVAVIDWYSRRVLAWRLSNTLEAGFCMDCLEDALRAHSRHEVFNTDQGSQFTSAANPQGAPGPRPRRHHSQGWTRSRLGQHPFDKLKTGFVERLWRASSTRISTSRAMGAYPSYCLG